MKEYATEGLVLRRDPAGEMDSRVIFYTRDLGKITARAKSARKITSKLAPHLEPLNVVRLRLIEKGGFQVADALRIRRLSHEHLPLTILLGEFVAEGIADAELWAELNVETPSLPGVLRVLGFDSRGRTCSSCDAPEPPFFSPGDAAYLCERCGKGRRGLIRIF